MLGFFCNHSSVATSDWLLRPFCVRRRSLSLSLSLSDDTSCLYALHCSSQHCSPNVSSSLSFSPKQLKLTFEAIRIDTQCSLGSEPSQMQQQLEQPGFFISMPKPRHVSSSSPQNNLTIERGIDGQKEKDRKDCKSSRRHSSCLAPLFIYLFSLSLSRPILTLSPSLVLMRKHKHTSLFHSLSLSLSLISCSSLTENKRNGAEVSVTQTNKRIRENCYKKTFPPPFFHHLHF